LRNRPHPNVPWRRGAARWRAVCQREIPEQGVGLRRAGTRPPAHHGEPTEQCALRRGFGGAVVLPGPSRFNITRDRPGARADPARRAPSSSSRDPAQIILGDGGDRGLV
jgi:hypothetical protein